MEDLEKNEINRHIDLLKNRKGRKPSEIKKIKLQKGANKTKITFPSIKLKDIKDWDIFKTDKTIYEEVMYVDIDKRIE